VAKAPKTLELERRVYRLRLALWSIHTILVCPKGIFPDIDGISDGILSGFTEELALRILESNADKDKLIKRLRRQLEEKE
jgi:hypothetical protein